MNEININGIKTTVISSNKKGELQDAYSPLCNFVDSKSQLGDFTTNNLKFDKNTPVDIIVTDEYDGSTNLIINDDKNYPKLINSGFSVQENKTFNIPVHTGNNVTNIYTNDTFEHDVNLLKLYNSIPSVKFVGLHDGGSFKVGSYVFYFKFIDSDGNVTNLIQESGIVQTHIGNVNSSKIRMGLEDENSFKCIEFEISNIDSGFDYIAVFYERLSTGNAQAAIRQYYSIKQNFPIIHNKCNVLLTGQEPVLEITMEDLKNQFADVQTVKSQAIVDNILFFGNVSSYEHDYQALQELAWRIRPSVVVEPSIGRLDTQLNTPNINGYYNANNVYYNVGYWPDEIYRFGIVFIYNNNLLSNVFNIQGVDLNQTINVTDEKVYLNDDGTFRTSIPDDCWFNRLYKTNSKGVVKLPKSVPFKYVGKQIEPQIVKIKFDLSWIGILNTGVKEGTKITGKDVQNVLQKHNIKGFFFVRQKRIPTIIAQGMVVGLTGRAFGSLPVLQDSIGQYISKSFLNEKGMLSPIQNDSVIIHSTVTPQALLVPDYEVNEASLNSIFTGQEFLLECIYNCQFTNKNNQQFYLQSMIDKTSIQNGIKLTAVPKETKIKTDGENYFSSMAGDPAEAWKTSDLNHNWENSNPQDLSASTSVVRGLWGSYVGMSHNRFQYGDVVNIKLNTYDVDIEFQKRFADCNAFYPITPYLNINSLSGINEALNIICTRGDCFNSLFTHRMMSNFIDPELPTNRKIVDPASWRKNYVVRASAFYIDEAIPNLCDITVDGFYLPDTIDPRKDAKGIVMALLLGQWQFFGSGSVTVKRTDPACNEIVQAFTASKNFEDVNIEKYYKSLKKMAPAQSEMGAGGLIKQIFTKDPDDSGVHGMASINRADVNAVSFGEWITFPICSRYNLALRDIDFSRPTEEAQMNEKRSFYPYSAMDPQSHLLESGIINGAAAMSLSSNPNPVYQTLPYYKQEYFNRVYWSKPNVTEKYINSYRMMFQSQYRDYNKEFGSITKLLPKENNLFVIFQHGIGVLPVNRQAMTEQESLPYLPSRNVLPVAVQTISRDFGSMWKDSVIITPIGTIYGVDTVAKKIWRITTGGFEFLSDFKLSRFLNENLDLSEYNFDAYQGHINVKTHYNNFKNDVIFTFYRDIPLDKDGNVVDLSGNLVLSDTEDPKSKIDHWERGTTWSLCYNETLSVFTTFYDWYPIESCNVDNIFFSFDKDQIDTVWNATDENKEIVPIDLNGIPISKIFIDKAFNYNVNQYSVQKKDVIISKVGDKNYISGIKLTFIGSVSKSTWLTFYYKGFKIKNIENTFNNEGKLGKDEGWSFARIQIDASNPRLKFFNVIISIDGTDTTLKNLSDIKLAEFRINDEKPEIQKNSALSWWNLRTNDPDETKAMYLWKHGQAGLYDNQGKIKPTNWYGKQHEFNFEFIVNDKPETQKIFNTLQIISNKAVPYKFEYEVVGEAYDWYQYKQVIQWICEYCLKQGLSLETGYQYVLGTDYGTLQDNHPDFPELFGYNRDQRIAKLPFLNIVLKDKHGHYTERNYNTHDESATDNWTNVVGNYSLNSAETVIVEDELLNEHKVHTESLGQDMSKYGRIRGNMQYLNDLWKIEVRPIYFQYAYLKDGKFTLTKGKETRLRDKYIKVKIRYSGEDLAVIQGIVTIFNESYA